MLDIRNIPFVAICRSNPSRVWRAAHLSFESERVPPPGLLNGFLGSAPHVYWLPVVLILSQTLLEYVNDIVSPTREASYFRQGPLVVPERPQGMPFL